jgi:hypothetical protein
MNPNNLDYRTNKQLIEENENLKFKLKDLEEDFPFMKELFYIACENPKEAE